jgi:peptidoglycan hydrolase-like protein with peptidoglycan-binding domain
MTSQDRIGAQQALIALGFNPGQPDGVIGINTRAAVRAWQKARGLPADGYLTVDLSHRLQSGAAADAPAAGPAPTTAATRN